MWSIEQFIWSEKETIGIINRQEKLVFSFPEKILQKNNRDMMQEILNAGSIEEKAQKEQKKRAALIVVG